MTERQFRVGDRVRWYQIDDTPLWNFDSVWSIGRGGYWAESIVTKTDHKTKKFVVDNGWNWPQPGHEQARYGEPGYLELVEAVKDPRFRVVDTVWDVGVCIVDTSQPEGSRTILPPSCRPELEAICEKLNTLVSGG
jgi:hypothetical protein